MVLNPLNESRVETSLVTKPTAYDSDGVEDQSSQNKFHWLSIGPMERSNIIPMSFYGRRLEGVSRSGHGLE